MHSNSYKNIAVNAIIIFNNTIIVVNRLSTIDFCLIGVSFKRLHFYEEYSLAVNSSDMYV